MPLSSWSKKATCCWRTDMLWCLWHPHDPSTLSQSGAAIARAKSEEQTSYGFHPKSFKYAFDRKIVLQFDLKSNSDLSNCTKNWSNNIQGLASLTSRSDRTFLLKVRGALSATVNIESADAFIAWFPPPLSPISLLSSRLRSGSL